MMDVNPLPKRLVRCRTDPLAMRLLSVDITVHHLSLARDSLMQIGIRLRTMTVYIVHAFYYSLKAVII
jgi:hypothetical protein